MNTLTVFLCIVGTSLCCLAAFVAANTSNNEVEKGHEETFSDLVAKEEDLDYCGLHMLLAKHVNENGGFELWRGNVAKARQIWAEELIQCVGKLNSSHHEQYGPEVADVLNHALEDMQCSPEVLAHWRWVAIGFIWAFGLLLSVNIVGCAGFWWFCVNKNFRPDLSCC